VAQKNRVRNGELYRFVADTRGAFVQPALYEAFGLTVVEAMTCGLPTFATCNGGPSEIIKHGKSGFHINPYHGVAVSRVLWKAWFRMICESKTRHFQLRIFLIWCRGWRGDGAGFVIGVLQYLH
jgi:glycogen synthase